MAGNGRNQGMQPSVFELLARDSLSGLIQPAVRHAVKCLYETNPLRYRVLWEWYDEVYAAINLFVENVYLKKYGGSLAENFYGMKRVINGSCQSASTGLPKLRSLFMLVVWPYILKKIEKFHSFLSTCSAASFSQRILLLRIIVNCYPWIKALFSTWTFILKIAYILSWCNIHSPELHFSNVHLVKLTPADFKTFNEQNSSMHIFKMFSLLDFRRSWQTLAVFISIITRCITFGLYLIQFLDFYHNSDFGQNLRLNLKKKDFKHIPAPHYRILESSVLRLETNKCPLCLQHRTNDTALSVSGYVFCYGCIYTYVSEEKKCPVTGLPARVDDLIKIFVRTT
ncbi:unnamed protein product [Thelazia callipaeda]|uniref:Peroxisome assembly protein 12 n=1 Tax=Thelazia callipaeda TaxID=103827 RepID=A0A0N5DB41_THECL|nr:unnamed protein product [Thelazia callipaeda]